MFKSWSLGQVLGVELKVHGSLVALLAIGGLFTLISSGFAGLAGAALVVLALVLSVTLHELGHIAAGRVYGNTTTGITLTPIGGVAQFDREAQSPQEEVVVALAGPAVSLALAGLAAAPLLLFGPSLVASVFFQINLMLAIFNLIPAYPMDGGRVLRGVLWKFQGYFDATWNAARAGQGIAVALGVAGLFLSPILIFVALFVGLQATLEIARLRALRAAAVARGAGFDPNGILEALFRQQRAPQGPPRREVQAHGPAPFRRVTWVRGPDGSLRPVDASSW